MTFSPFSIQSDPQVRINAYVTIIFGDEILNFVLSFSLFMYFLDKIMLFRQIGKTAIKELKKINPYPDVRLLAKLEFNNLTSSIKDRAAFHMVEEAEKSEKLDKSKIILESTSGNTGIALAAIGMVKGYKVILVASEAISEERKAILREFGSEIIFSNAGEGADGAYIMADEVYQANPKRYFKVDQYSNFANPHAHYLTTAKEIWNQSKGMVSHFVAGTGTSGTIVGSGRQLKELNQAIKIYAAEPQEEMHGIEGLKNMRVERVPLIYDEGIIDHKIYIKTEDAYEMTGRLMKEERLFTGQSSGLNVCAALEIAKRLKKGTIVTVLPDTGYRYLSTGIFPDDFFDVFIPRLGLDDIRRYAKEGYPYEICGLMTGEMKGNKKIIRRVFPCQNINQFSAEDRFEIDPKEYLQISKKLNKGESIVGIYHSHPDHPSRPSVTDLTFASPVYSYFIIATIGKAISSIRSWILDETDREFKEEFIKII